MVPSIYLIYFEYCRYYFQKAQEAKQKGEIQTGLSLIPWFHAYGFITTFAVIALNVKIVFLIRFEELQFLETIQNYKVKYIYL